MYLISLFSFFVVIVSAKYPLEFRENPPLYCSSLSRKKDRQKFIHNRSIPDLSTNIEGVELKQVQVITRHGARTLYKPLVSWPEYISNADCTVAGEVVTGYSESGTTFNFEKHRDIRPDSQVTSSCFHKQLIPEGHEQHRLIGKALAKAYFGKQLLFDLKHMDESKIHNHIFFRSTNTERTLMSGAELITSLIRSVNPNVNNPQIKLHTAEYAADALPLKEDICPDLAVMKNEALTSDEYLSLFGDRHRNARELAASILDLETRVDSWSVEVFDGLYSAICVDKNVPDEWNANDLKEILTAVSEEEFWKWTYNDASYSKLAVGRFGIELKVLMFKMFPEYAEQLLLNTNQSSLLDFAKSNLVSTPKAPFVVISSHDTVLGPFLATFGNEMANAVGKYGERFPPFASTLVVEAYETTEYPMIRLIYNGKVMTQHIRGCPKDDDLCPMETFFLATDWAVPELALRPCMHEKPAVTSGYFIITKKEKRKFRGKRRPWYRR